jgi:uncharacterized protein YndB with AHSA1/START domain
MSKITVTTKVKAPIEKVWEYFNGVEHYAGWSFASNEWAAEGIKNDLKVGGELKVRNFAKDESMSFIFGGIYNEVLENKVIDYTMEDGRSVRVEFNETSDGIELVETFDAESMNSEELQKNGWQAYLDNFKKYTESH